MFSYVICFLDVVKYFIGISVIVKCLLQHFINIEIGQFNKSTVKIQRDKAGYDMYCIFVYIFLDLNRPQDQR